jgi:hypothetical protein
VGDAMRVVLGRVQKMPQHEARGDLVVDAPKNAQILISGLGEVVELRTGGLDSQTFYH